MNQDKKVEIIPAVLPRDFAEIKDKVEMVKEFVETVQVDICDGHFVPSFTWPYKKHDDNFEKIISEEMGMPFWEDVDYEFDLMIKDPQNEVERWVRAGAKRIVLHYGSAQPEELQKVRAEWGGFVEFGIAFGLDQIESLKKDIDLPLSESLTQSFDYIQLMGIEKIGYQGQKFDERALALISSVKEKMPDKPVSIDGGVSLETAKALKNEGADRLVAGSAIFHSDNIPTAVRNLKNI